MSLRGLLLVLAATSLWGTLGPVERIALREGVTPLGVSLARGILASGLVGLTALRRRPDALRPALREIPACLGCGIFGVAGLYTLSNVAFVTIPVGLATLLFYTAPFWALLGERLLGKERLTLRRCAAFGLGLGGVWLSVGGVAGIRSGRIDPAGLLCAAGGGLSYAVYLLIGRHGIGREDPFKMYVQTFFWGTGVLALLAWGTGDLSAIRGVAGGALPPCSGSGSSPP
jgi:drug/metabolite transporter (DMT)-like permease